MHTQIPRINWLIFTIFVIIGSVLFSLWLISIEAFEAMYEYTRDHEDWDLDEIILTVVAVIVVYGLMSTFALLFLTRKIARYALLKHARQQEQFYVTQNLQALGTMLAGVAHSLNNMIQPILTVSSYLLKTTDKNTDIYGDIDTIHTAALQAHDLAHEILDISRKNDREMEGIALTQVVEDIGSILKAAVPSRIALHTELVNCGHVNIPVRHVQTAILNVVQNAVDAIEESGKITLTTLRIRAEHPNEFLGLRRTWAVVEITDDGIGMDKETRKQIFDPFYTTKIAGKGTGLGLSITQNIVQDCGGFIQVDSEPDKGTTVTLHLPALDADPDETLDADADETAA